VLLPFACSNSFCTDATAGAAAGWFLRHNLAFSKEAGAIAFCFN
jgi:hypothetical protein